MLNTLFTLTLIVTALVWALMILAPRATLTQNVLESYLPKIFLAACYLLVLVGILVDSLVSILNGTGGRFVLDFSSAQGLALTFAAPQTALLIWLHLLVVDLAAGYLIYRYNLEHEKPVRLILVVTLFFAPLGILAHFINRALARAAEQATKAAGESGTAMVAR